MLRKFIAFEKIMAIGLCSAPLIDIGYVAVMDMNYIR